MLGAVSQLSNLEKINIMPFESSIIFIRAEEFVLQIYLVEEKQMLQGLILRATDSTNTFLRENKAFYSWDFSTALPGANCLE